MDKEEVKRKRMANLKTRQLTTEEAREMNRKSLETRRRKKQGRERVLELLSTPLPKTAQWQSVRTQLENAGLSGAQDFEMAMHFAMLVKSVMEGDSKAYKELLTVGQLTKEAIELKTEEPIVIKFGE